MRGAWIEILVAINHDYGAVSLPMRGAWIEILHKNANSGLILGRSPCGERGLKSLFI